METLQKCPVCNEPNFREFLKTKDYFLTGAEFTIVKCIACGFRFTNPRPEENTIHAYYDSPDYIAHDSSAFSPMQLVYKTARKFMLGRKLSLIKKYSSGKTLLDIGCGTGEFLAFCSAKGYAVKGIEPGEKARNFAKSKHSLSVSDVEGLDLCSPSSFSIITMWHVLEHVHALKERMEQLYRILDKNGLLLIAVPNSNSFDATQYGPYWAAYDLPRHLYHFTPETMQRLIENSGFRLENITPLKLDAFYISLLSEKYKTGKQNYISPMLTGIRSNYHARKNNKNYSSLIYLCRKRQDLK